MSINNVHLYQGQPNPQMMALGNTFGAASQMLLMQNQLLNNMTYAAQGFNRPYMPTVMPGMNPMLANNPASTLLQSVGQLLSSVTPLLNTVGALSGNPRATLLANALGNIAGSLGNIGLGLNQVTAGLGGLTRPHTPVMGFPAGSPVMGFPATPVLGIPTGTVMGTPMGIPMGVGPSIQMGFGFGGPLATSGVTPQSALQWALTYGGPNMSSPNDVVQAMNLFSIANTGQRMF